MKLCTSNTNIPYCNRLYEVLKLCYGLRVSETSCFQRTCCGPARGFLIHVRDNNGQVDLNTELNISTHFPAFISSFIRKNMSLSSAVSYHDVTAVPAGDHARAAKLQVLRRLLVVRMLGLLRHGTVGGSTCWQRHRFRQAGVLAVGAQVRRL